MPADIASEMVEAALQGEVVSVYPMGGDLGMLATPPLSARGYGYGDLVRLDRAPKGLVVGPIVRETTAQSYRYPHNITDREQVEVLLNDLHWKGAVARATFSDIVVAIPRGVDRAIILERLIDAGVSAARAELQRSEVLLG